jgi:uncharacterized protein YqfA (UPF0365 family)
MEPRVAYLLGVATAFGGMLVVWVLFRLLGPWVVAWATGAPVSLIQVFGMRMRGSDPALIVTALNTLTRLGERVSPMDVEVAYLTLPVNQRNLGALLRAVRPDVMARLEVESRTRRTGGAA